MMTARYLTSILADRNWDGVGNLAHIRVKLTGQTSDLSSYLLAASMFGRLIRDLNDNVRWMMFYAQSDRTTGFRIESLVKAKTLIAASTANRSGAASDLVSLINDISTGIL